MEVEVLPSPSDFLKSNKIFRIKSTASAKSLFNANLNLLSQPSEPRLMTKKAVLDFSPTELPSPNPDSKGLLNRLKRWPSAAVAIKQLNRLKTDELRTSESVDKTGGRSRGNTEVQQLLMKNFMAQRRGNFSVCKKLSNEHEQQQMRNASYQDRNYESLKCEEDPYRIRKKTSMVQYLSSHQGLDIETHHTTENEYHNPKEGKESPMLILPKIGNKLDPKDLVFGPNVKEHIYRKHALEIAQGIRYATKQVKAPPVSQVNAKQVSLKPGKKAPEKTLVLDLDETLITSKCAEVEKGTVQMVNAGTEDIPLKLAIRPYVKEFLRKMSKEFEIVVFTAADKNYADCVVNVLDPHQKIISHVLHRDHCLRTKKGILIKDLRIIKDRDLRNMVIVDNFTPSFSFQIGNGIPIITWKGDPADEELKYLMDYLLEAKTYDDMRVFNRERLRLEELSDVQPEKFAYGGM